MWLATPIAPLASAGSGPLRPELASHAFFETCTSVKTKRASLHGYSDVPCRFLRERRGCGGLLPTTGASRRAARRRTLRKRLTRRRLVPRAGPVAALPTRWVHALSERWRRAGGAALRLALHERSEDR